MFDCIRERVYVCAFEHRHTVRAHKLVFRVLFASVVLSYDVRTTSPAPNEFRTRSKNTHTRTNTQAATKHTQQTLGHIRIHTGRVASSPHRFESTPDHTDERTPNVYLCCGCRCCRRRCRCRCRHSRNSLKTRRDTNPGGLQSHREPSHLITSHIRDRHVRLSASEYHRVFGCVKINAAIHTVKMLWLVSMRSHRVAWNWCEEQTNTLADVRLASRIGCVLCFGWRVDLRTGCRARSS